MSGDAGLIAIAVSIIAAVVGWASTRGSDSSKMVSDYMREINADNIDLRSRVDLLEEENRQLLEHVGKCDVDNEALRQRVAALEGVLRRLLGDDGVDSLDRL